MDNGQNEKNTANNYETFYVSNRIQFYFQLKTQYKKQQNFIKIYKFEWQNRYFAFTFIFEKKSTHK